MIGFIKWISSTKFIICVVSLVMIYTGQWLFSLAPDTAAGHIKDLAMAYFAARIAEPLVEYAIAKFQAKREKP